MPPFDIREVDAKNALVAWKIHKLNREAPEVFPELESRHLRDGLWWFATLRGNVVAFAGLVAFLPGTGATIGYLKRAYVVPSARGHGLQRALIAKRCAKATALGFTLLVTECGAGNVRSSANLQACGFDIFDPDQRWGAADSIYWVKRLGPGGV